MKSTEQFNYISLLNYMPTLMPTQVLDSSDSGPSINRLSQKGRRRRNRQKLSNCGRRVRK